MELFLGFLEQNLQKLSEKCLTLKKRDDFFLKKVEKALQCETNEKKIIY